MSGTARPARRVAPGVVAVTAGNPGPLTLDGTRSYLIGSRRPALLDPGPLDARHLDAIGEALAGRRPAWICLTHAHSDHSAAAAAAGERFGAPIAASAETLRRLDLDGRSVGDGDSLELDDGETRLETLATPGHSGDHLCYLWHPSRALFTGDLVLGRGTSVVAHPDGSVADYLDSLAKLIDLHPTMLLPGHGEPVSDPRRKLEEYRDHRLERDRQVLRAAREGARSVAGIRALVYPELPRGLEAAADLSILAHLEHLRAQGHELPDELERDRQGPGRRRERDLRNETPRAIPAGRSRE